MIPPLKPRHLVLSFVLLAVLLAASCISPAPPAPAPEAPGRPEIAAPTQEAEPAADLSAQPTPELEPSPTVQALDLPPVVVATVPERGQEHPLEAPVVVHFDQAMDAESTGSAFAIEPDTTGTVAVTDDELMFTPSEPLTRDQAYLVTVDERARSQSGRALAAPVQLHFNTVGYLEVTSTQPADGSSEVNVDNPITVVFNRPIVPLTGLDQMQDLPQPVTLEPYVSGTGEWLNTSIYTFTPEKPLAGATDYTARVTAGLEDLRGALLAEDYVFAFRTATPIVTGFEPTGPQISPNTAVTVTFSQPMDRASSEAAFSLREAQTDQSVAGRFQWSGGDRVLRFQPEPSLAYDASYVAEISADARSAQGQGTLREPYQARFQTAPVIAILATDPADGEEFVEPEDEFVVTFAGIVDQKTLGSDAFTILPEPTSVFSYYLDYEGRWVIRWPMLPQTRYTVTLSGEIGDRFGNTLDEDTIVSFATGDRRPFAHLNVPGEVGTYNAYTETLIAVSYRNVSQLDFQLYSINEAQAQWLLGPDQWQARQEFRPNPDSLVREWTVVVTPERNANMLSKLPLAEDGGPLAPGIYWVEMRAPEVRYRSSFEEPGQDVPRHLLIVSPLNVIAKKGSGEILVWATDLRSGQPAPGLPVRIPGNPGGVTDQDGIYRQTTYQREPWQPLTIFVGQEFPIEAIYPRPYGVVSTDWSQGIGPWEYDLAMEFPAPEWQGSFYSDRPLYRPGQVIYWKGILREDNDNVYRVPEPGTEFEVLVYDGQGNQIYQEVHETNAFGTIHGELLLDEEATLGFYYLEARLLNVPKDAPFQPSFGLSFNVAEYRKPEFEVALITDQDEYLQGDTIEVTLEARYFFGGSVSNAQVQWTVFSEDALFTYQGDPEGPWYSFADFTGWEARPNQRFGSVVTSGSGKTDPQGRLQFRVPADIGDRLQSQLFTIDARVTDLNNQEVAADSRAIVHKGLVYPGVAPQSYVAQVNQPATVHLITVDWDSQPVANQELTVVVNKARWLTVQEKAEDGQFYWVSRVEETPVLTQTVTTAADGTAQITWTPDAGGQYKINATVTDERGNRVRSAAFQWVSDSPDTYVSWQVENNDRIELVADKPLYQVGDVAQVLVPHPYQGEVEALLTIERGSIIEARRITLTSNSETLAIPIQADHVPNVYISVTVVKGQDSGGDDLGSFKLGYVKLPVDTVTKELQVILTPNKSELRPGETVTFTVQVSDSEGRPVQGEFSLALVDKALLSLAAGQEATLLDTFYRERGLGIQTASTLVLNLDRLNLQLREGAKGGGGGDGMASFFVDVRSDFEDAALWEPTLVTDENGQAVVSVQLPDNLTTWRLDGRGVTVDTKVGQATVEVITSLPLLVRPVLPRFFVSGDQAEIGAVVNNNTDQDRTIVVSLVASGLTTSAEDSQQVAVPAGDQVKVTWPVQVAVPDSQDAVSETSVRFTAQEIGATGPEEPLSDAVLLTLPVYRYSSPETVATAGTVALDEERLEVIVLPANADPTEGELRVRLDPSLAAGTLESLGWLEHFPYECTEQVVSKFLPNVVTYQALAALDIADPELAANLRTQIGIAVQKLQQRQNSDGGWGWWGGERSQPFVSAYVVFGLVEARQAGFAVDDQTINRGADYLERQLKPVSDLKDWELNQQAFLLYVLAEAGRGDTGRTVALYDVRERLDNYAKAYLILAFQQLAEQGESTAQARISTLLDDLSGAAIVSATGAHWEEDSRDVWTMNTDTRSTALVLAAMARTDPENALAPNAVRWLMVARQAGIWETTQENVWAIIALTDWMVASGELEGDYSYRVALNDQELDGGDVNRENVNEPVDLRVAIRDLLVDSANGLAISRFAEGDQTGQGQLYYTTHLEYFLPAAELEPMDRGIVVAREYKLVDPITGKMVSDAGAGNVAVGDTVAVTLTLVAPNDLYYLVVESPLPAGAEAIDPTLATTSQVYEGPQFESTQEEDALAPPIWWWVPTHSELRDEKAVLFATELPAGTYQYSYQMRASLPGQFQTLPATAYEMYFPEVWGRSAGDLFTVGG